MHLVIYVVIPNKNRGARIRRVMEAVDLRGVHENLDFYSGNVPYLAKLFCPTEF